MKTNRSINTKDTVPERRRERSAVHGNPTNTKGNHSRLTKAERDRLPASEFALLERRQYPIPDRYHAELALRDLHHASLKDQVLIRQAIRKKFPGLIR